MLKPRTGAGRGHVGGLMRQIPITEYLPKKVKMAITGNGNASKEQVAGMLVQLLKYRDLPKHLDSTDALGIAVCHLFQQLPPKPRNGKLLRMGRVRPQQPIARERRVTARYKKEIINPGVTF